MRWLSFVLSAAITVAVGVAAWAPWVTPFSALEREEGLVKEVQGNDSSATSSALRTVSGQTVSCGSGPRTQGCEPSLMRSLRDSGTPVQIWHNGQRVYQLAVGAKVVVPYEHAHRGRSFALALLFVLLLGWCFWGARRAGFGKNYAREA